MTMLLSFFLLLGGPASAQATAPGGASSVSAPSTGTAEGPLHPDTLVVLIRNPWESLDPAVAYDIGSYLIFGNIYEALVGFGKGLDDFTPLLSRVVPKLENGLASSDGLRWTFPIRSGVKFHDGTVLTPEDVRYSLLREMLLEDDGGTSSLLLRPLFGRDSPIGRDGRWALDPKDVEKAIQVQGDKLVFQLQAPFPGFLKMLASWPVVTSKAWAVAHGDWDGALPAKGGPRLRAGTYLSDHADGTGPFKVETSSADKTEVLLARHDGYWGEAPKLKKVLVRSERSDAMRAAHLQQGDADYVYLERPLLHLVDGEPGVSILEGIPGYTSGETYFFTFRVEPKDNPRLGSGALDGKGIPSDFFLDNDVRAGFAYAVDYEQYLKSALRGKGVRATGPIPDSLLTDPGLQNPFSYDPKKAEASLRKAYGGKLWERGFTLTLSYPRESVRRQIACELMKDGLEKLNPLFKVDLEALARSDFEKAYQSHGLPFFVASLAADYPDPHAMTFQFLHSQGYFPKAQRLYDAGFNKLEEAASKEMDAAKRLKLYTELQRKAVESVDQIYTYYPIQFKAVRTWLKGLDKDQGVSGMSYLNLLYFQPLTKSSTP